MAGPLGRGSASWGPCLGMSLGRVRGARLAESGCLPGLSDIPGEAMVKLYCPKCMDVYTPKSSRHHHTDGAYFGTGFPHMLFMVHPEYRPKRPANQFVPRWGSGTVTRGQRKGPGPLERREGWAWSFFQVWFIFLEHHLYCGGGVKLYIEASSDTDIYIQT